MNRPINYERFSKVRAVVVSSGLEEPEEQESVFRALVKCLVHRRVCNTEGAPWPDRRKCFGYLLEIFPKLGPEDVDLVIRAPDKFYEKFIFYPGREVSLYSVLKDRYKNSKVLKAKNISLDEIYEDYRSDTMCSPYEKASSMDDILFFLDGVESRAYPY